MLTEVRLLVEGPRPSRSQRVLLLQFFFYFIPVVTTTELVLSDIIWCGVWPCDVSVRTWTATGYQH